MKLCDILRELQARYPSSFTDEEKIAFLNHAVRDIYLICSKKSIYTAEAAEEIQLPEEVNAGTIRSVFLGGEEYLNSARVRSRGLRYTLDAENKLRLSGGGTGNVEITYVLYSLFKTLADIEADDTIADKTAYYESQTGGIEDRFAELLVLGALYRMAAAAEDMTQAGNFKGQFDQSWFYTLTKRYSGSMYPITKMVG